MEFDVTQERERMSISSRDGQRHIWDVHSEGQAWAHHNGANGRGESMNLEGGMGQVVKVVNVAKLNAQITWLRMKCLTLATN